MEMRDEEYTNMEIENLIAKEVIKGDTKRFLWHVGTAVVIGFLAAVLLGLSGLPAPDSAHRGDFVFLSNHNPSETIAAPQALAVHRLERSAASRLSEHNPEIAVTPWT